MERDETNALQAIAPTPFRVGKVRRETVDTVTLTLSPINGGEFRFAPGQFNMMYVFGVGEVPISISGPPDDLYNVTHTVRRVGAVTNAIAALKKNAIAGIRGPFGVAWPVHKAEGQDVVIAAGGIGLAPLRPVLYEILANRRRFGRVSLLYGARTPQDLLYRRELERWGGRFDVDVEVTVDNATPEWSGHVGVVTTLIPWANLDPRTTVAMVCGPEVMMRFMVRDLLSEGVAANHVYVSMERNMRCAVGWCGHCQYGPEFICRDGPVFPYSRLKRWFDIREL